MIDGMGDPADRGPDLRRASARGGAVVLTQQGLAAALQVALAVVLARLLMPEHYGLIAMAMPVIGLIGVFRDLGLASTVMSARELTHEQLSTLFWLNVVLSCVIAAAAAACGPLAAWFYGDGRLTVLAAALAGGFALDGLGSAHDALLQRRMQYLRRSLCAIPAQLFGAAGAIALAASGAGVWALVAAQLLPKAAYAALLWAAAPWRPGRPRRGAGALVRFGAQVTLSNVALFVGRNIDNVLIGRVWGGEQLGYYSRAFLLLSLPQQQVNYSLHSVALTALSRVADQPARLRSGYLQLLELIGLLMLPLSAGLALMAPQVVETMFGARWLPAAPMLTALGAALAIQSMAHTSGWVALARGRSGRFVAGNVIQAAFAVVAAAAGVRHGAVGVAAALAAASWIAGPIAMVVMMRGSGIGATGVARALRLPLAATAASAAAIWGAARLTAGAPAWATLLAATTSGVAVCVALAALAPGPRSRLLALWRSLARREAIPP